MTVTRAGSYSFLIETSIGEPARDRPRVNAMRSAGII